MEMQVFFDYACPFCLRGFAYLKELSTKKPNLKLQFIPCEAHPRPETHGLHTDLCAAGMYIAMESGIDLWDYHEAIYKAAILDHVNIESPKALAQAVSKLLDANAFEAALSDARYKEQVDKNNTLAYDESGVWAVPAFRMHGKALDSQEGVGVTFDALAAFMDRK